MTDKTEYRDESHINEVSDVDQSKVPSTVKKLATWIRQKMYGEDVRESIARGIEKSSEVAQSAVDTANDTASRQDESEKIVQNTSNNVNNVLSDITNNAGDSAAPEVIAARKPSDKEQAYKSLGERLDADNQITDFDGNVDIGGELPKTLKDKIQVFKSRIPRDNFNVAIISDSHYDDRQGRGTIDLRGDLYAKSEDSFKHLTAFNYLSDAVDVMITNGDNINGFDLQIDRSKRELSAYCDKFLTDFDDTDRYCLLGNHDDASAALGNSSTLETVISNDELKEMFRTRDCINEEIRDGGSLYFYKDYDDKKIRLIGLNSLDDPDTLNSDGTIKYIKWLVHNYSQQQINWLANTALMNIPKAYQILVVAHTPLVMDIETNGYDAWNHRIVRGLLGAASVGTEYTGASDDGTPEDLRVVIHADYSDQGEHPVIGFIAGHVHAENMWNWSEFTMTSVTCDVNNDKTIAYDDPKSMAFTVYSIDTVSKQVTMYGFGRATDREYSY